MAPYLELEHVFDAQQGFKRPLKEGRLAVENIANIGVKSRSGNDVIIEATVVRSTNINSEPVTVNITISYQNPVTEQRLKDITCSCPAGACKQHCCKHAMAVIIILERKDESEIENLSCTDTKQAWGNVKATMAQFEPAPLKEFCHFTAAKKIYRRQMNCVSADLSSELKKMFLTIRPQSESAIFWGGSREPKTVEVPLPTSNSLRSSFFRECLKNTHYIIIKASQLTEELLLKCSPEEVQFYHNNIVLSEERAEDIFLASEGQDNDIWESSRFGRITGSNSYDLFTYYNNKNPDWDNKLLNIYDPTFKSQAMEAGNFYEPFALKKYISEICKEQPSIECMRVGIIINPLLPWLGFSADALICKGNKILKLWENKTPLVGKTTTAANVSYHLSYMDKNGKLRQKSKYYGQVQLGMVLLNLPATDFSIYCTGPIGTFNPLPHADHESIHIETITRNESFCDKYLERLCHVYFEQILPWLTKLS